MAITRRSAQWEDIEPSLAIDADTSVGDLEAWKQFYQHPFFLSAVLEASPAIQGHRLIGIGTGLFVSARFVDAELSQPRPHIGSRMMARVRAGQPVLATRDEIGRANAGHGIDVVLPYVAWRDQILTDQDRHAVYTQLASGFARDLGGFRIHRILVETTSKHVTEFHGRSVEYLQVAAFPELERVTYLMTRESATAMPGSLGNVIFEYHEPVLRLRESDQQLLWAALKGITDLELADELGITFAAVKARWRSTFARVTERMPGLAEEARRHEGRGPEKRHRILAYVREHMQELRPFDYSARTACITSTRAAGECRPDGLSEIQTQKRTHSPSSFRK